MENWSLQAHDAKSRGDPRPGPHLMFCLEIKKKTGISSGPVSTGNVDRIFGLLQEFLMTGAPFCYLFSQTTTFKIQVGCHWATVTAQA